MAAGGFLLQFFILFHVTVSTQLRTLTSTASKTSDDFSVSLDSEMEKCEFINFHEYQTILDWAIPILSWTQDSWFYGYIRDAVEPLVFTNVFQTIYTPTIPGIGEYEVVIEVIEATAHKVSDLKVHALTPIPKYTNRILADVDFAGDLQVDLMLEVAYGKTEKNGGIVWFLCLFYRFTFCGAQEKNIMYMDINTYLQKPRVEAVIMADMVACSGNFIQRNFQRAGFFGRVFMNGFRDWWNGRTYYESTIDEALKAVVRAEVKSISLKYQRITTNVQAKDHPEIQTEYPALFNWISKKVNELSNGRMIEVTRQQVEETALAVANAAIETFEPQFKHL